jgi:hypothetical protein
VKVRVDAAAVERIVDRAGARGVDAAGRFLATEQQRRAPQTVKGSVGFTTGRDAGGWFARAGILSWTDQAVWHRYTAGGWTIVPYPDRRTAAVPSWRLFEFGTPNTGARPFIRPALESNTATVRRLLTGGA